jgi:hypothetical protein
MGNTVFNKSCHQGVTKRCRLSWLTNSALVYEPKCEGREGVAGIKPTSTAVHMETGAQINLGDLTPYLTRVADPDPGLGAFLTPGSGMGESQHPDPG